MRSCRLARFRARYRRRDEVLEHHAQVLQRQAGAAASWVAAWVAAGVRITRPLRLAVKRGKRVARGAELGRQLTGPGYSVLGRAAVRRRRFPRPPGRRTSPAHGRRTRTPGAGRARRRQTHAALGDQLSRIASTCNWTVTSSAEVGSSAISKLRLGDQHHRDHRAWPLPPDTHAHAAHRPLGVVDLTRRQPSIARSRARRYGSLRCARRVSTICSPIGSPVERELGACDHRERPPRKSRRSRGAIVSKSGRQSAAHRP